jgi:hypothetical protein
MESNPHGFRNICSCFLIQIVPTVKYQNKRWKKVIVPFFCLIRWIVLLCQFDFETYSFFLLLEQDSRRAASVGQRSWRRQSSSPWNGQLATISSSSTFCREFDACVFLCFTNKLRLPFLQPPSDSTPGKLCLHLVQHRWTSRYDKLDVRAKGLRIGKLI